MQPQSPSPVFPRQQHCTPYSYQIYLFIRLSGLVALSMLTQQNHAQLNLDSISMRLAPPLLVLCSSWLKPAPACSL